MITTRLLITDEMKANQPVNVTIVKEFGPLTTEDSKNGQVFSGNHVVVESRQETLDKWFDACEVFIVGIDEDEITFDIYRKE